MRGVRECGAQISSRQIRGSSLQRRRGGNECCTPCIAAVTGGALLHRYGWRRARFRSRASDIKAVRGTAGPAWNYSVSSQLHRRPAIACASVHDRSALRAVLMHVLARPKRRTLRKRSLSRLARRPSLRRAPGPLRRCRGTRCGRRRRRTSCAAGFSRSLRVLWPRRCSDPATCPAFWRIFGRAAQRARGAQTSPRAASAADVGVRV